MRRIASAVMMATALGAMAMGGVMRAQGGIPVPSAIAAPSAQEKEITQLKAQLADWPQLARYRADDLTLPAVVDGRVVFYGDSITDAWVHNGGKFFPGKPYVNRGISGQTTPQMLVRFRQDVVDLHPDAVVILAGTNDIAGNTGPSTLVMIEDNFRSMTEIAKANGIKVILASVTPVARYPWRPEVQDPAGEIRDLNRWLRSFCGEQKLTYLDYWTAMAGPDGGMKPGISIDGVHPNAAGYAIMEPLAEKAIATTLK